MTQRLRILLDENRTTDFLVLRDSGRRVRMRLSVSVANAEGLIAKARQIEPGVAIEISRAAVHALLHMLKIHSYPNRDYKDRVLHLDLAIAKATTNMSAEAFEAVLAIAEAGEYATLAPFFASLAQTR